ncbi:helix-turn-helix domain-containing protein [Sphingobacterium sp. DK4209]|uniref:Helix-turn-helix domain-containing protein n=1 Tax=Sphingobacterium zhuxiongii TaxID=2662364 RepID=A0A5Q0Q993_9SPHI|nr:MULTISPECIES: AraC family transcriptional regulator [unclassified Sphingobacterium]MVZ67052.1 helix-turn-helix domain-containing protein [Sphingobacterium sp. DK4209]QGA26657.1 helix-turn-helix domain-containing protein [Sphingobacterium sp. dk4302]
MIANHQKTDSKVYMSPDTESKLLNALNEWELDRFFLNPGCSINSTAREIGCNSKYLSFVVNKNKGSDFPNYINMLRICYLEDYLRKTEQARSFKLAYLAAYCGFSSYGKFAKSIKDHRGLNPTQFIVYFDQKIA